jgi:transcription initiation factor IIE alpha subunit
MDYVKRKDSSIVQPSDLKEYDNIQRYKELFDKILQLETRLTQLESKSIGAS